MSQNGHCVNFPHLVELFLAQSFGKSVSREKRQRHDRAVVGENATEKKIIA